LFGHEKGAFTGATERHAGKFVEASGGTLLLDEVAELPLAAQVKLLRALQEDEVDPVGGRKSVKVDVRVVSASNRNLIAAVKEGRFREDLFYRLHVFPITVPPLRERPEDIPDLVRHFLVRFNAEEGKRIRMVAADAMALLARCPWPGNVRQLENAIFRAVVLAEGDEIGVDEFPQLAAQAVRAPLPPASEPAPAPEPEAEAPLMLEPAAPVGPAGPVAPSLQPQGTGLALLGPAGEVRSLADIEADVIRFAIAHYRGQMSEVARKLQIGRSTLYRKLDDLGVEDAGNASSSTDTVAAG